MPEARTAASVALARELFAEQRFNFCLVPGFIALAWLLERLSPAFATTLLEAASMLMAVNAILVTFLIFTRTESNPRRDRRGFPARYFTLPVSTLTLVAVPLGLGTVVATVVFGALLAVDALPVRPAQPLWSLAKFASFMLTYQMLLWCAARLGALRMIVIGLLSFVFIVLPLSSLTSVLLALWSAAACGLSWLAVARQRAGGTSHASVFDTAHERLSALLPQRSAGFASMHHAQLWYEWRKVGYLLPLIVCSLLLTMILPLTFVVSPARGFALLVVTLLLPVLMAVPLGRAFSKADTWAMDSSLATFTEKTRLLSVPAFLAVRPLSSDDVVVAKLQAAALSTALAWAPTIGFTLLWQYGWADTSALRELGTILWAIQHHSLLPQFAILVLLVVLLVLLTWRFQVAGLWIGLSGSGRLFVVTTLPLVLIPTAGLLLLDEFFSWLGADHRRLTPFVWCVGALVAAKYWLAAFTWRDASPALTRRYLPVWACGTLCAAALALLVAEPFGLLLNVELPVVRSLLLLAALMVMPFAQLGLAPTQFARNRHG